jgi:hypothetical protein
VEVFQAQGQQLLHCGLHLPHVGDVHGAQYARCGTAWSINSTSPSVQRGLRRRFCWVHSASGCCF